MATNKMQGYFWKKVSDTDFYEFYALYVVASILVSMAAPITTYFKDSDWLLKNFVQ